MRFAGSKRCQSIDLPDDNVTLFDTPGLAFPIMGVPRPLQAVLGTQIAQTRVPASAVAFLARHLPLERLYGLRKVDDTEQHWSAIELCEALALKKGFRLRGGKPDAHRAAIFFLQEAYEGRLVLYLMPPSTDAASTIARTGFVPRSEPIG